MKIKDPDRKNSNHKDDDLFPLSLSKYLALCGIASRRKSVEIIKAGTVSLNGIIVTEPGRKVDKTDRVVYQNQPVELEPKVYIMLNKPRGYVCTSDDKNALHKAIDLVAIKDTRLYTVGRLDKDSEGLLLLTNDGDFANRITHPRYEVIKQYLVTADTALSRDDIQLICSGIEDDGDRLKALKIEWVDGCCYRFFMGEGKKREVRRLIKAVGKKTIRLQRVAIGGLMLGNLPVGEWKKLSPTEVALSVRNN